jgi:hypothetical protein
LAGRRFFPAGRHQTDHKVFNRNRIIPDTACLFTKKISVRPYLHDPRTETGGRYC